MFGISGTELFLILVFALLVFGPDKLPEFGRTIGRFVREFKRAQDQMESMIRTEMYGDSNTTSATSLGKPRIIPDDDDDEDDEEEEED